MAFLQSSRNIATRICLLILLLVPKITYIYFSFLLGLDMFVFLSSHGSSLIGLPFLPLGCFRLCDVCSVLVTQTYAAI